MPLSEDEQRILQEMEQKLFEHDRPFAHRVHAQSAKVDRARDPHAAGLPLRSAGLIFTVGFLLLLFSFQSSLLLATLGFLLMFLAAVMFGRRLHGGGAVKAHPAETSSNPTSSGNAEFAESLRRLRSRFWQH
ncbi:MAG TPA: DUF3040 domain-containing protein [Acidimicrobiales bacterium]